MTYPYTENMGQCLDTLSCFLVHPNNTIKRHASGILAELKKRQFEELKEHAEILHGVKCRGCKMKTTLCICKHAN